MTDTLSRRSRTSSPRTKDGDDNKILHYNNNNAVDRSPLLSPSSSSSSSSLSSSIGNRGKDEDGDNRHRRHRYRYRPWTSRIYLYWSRNKTQILSIVILFVVVFLLAVWFGAASVKQKQKKGGNTASFNKNKNTHTNTNNRRHDYGGTSETNTQNQTPRKKNIKEEEEEESDYDHDDDHNNDGEEGLGICYLNMLYNNIEEMKKKKSKSNREVGGEVGPCFNTYPKLVKPEEGWLQGIDYLHFRDTHTSKVTDRITCMDHCLDQHVLPPGTSSGNGSSNNNNNNNNNKRKQLRTETKDNHGGEATKVKADNIMLIEAAKSGMVDLTRKLMKQGQGGYNLDPLYRIVEPEDFKNARSFNSIQEAIRGGYTEIVHILAQGNVDLVIDHIGRTVKDYVLMHGSPIRPHAAKTILGIGVNTVKKSNINSNSMSHRQNQEEAMVASHSGWNTTTEYPYDETVCDIDVIAGDKDLLPEIYHRDYFVTGRPLVLRNQVSEAEASNFQKDTFVNGKSGWKDYKFKVGPTAYPSITDQKHCRTKFDIEQLESKHKCTDMPDTPMVYAYHPSGDSDFTEIWPDLDGNVITHPHSSFRAVKQFFGHIVEDEDNLSWQVFFGGDGSGATLHSHYAAFNMLYVGIKEWKITPPLHRGWSGMPSKDVRHKLNDDIALTCIQQPGDLFIIPNFWGHMTINHGFTIGSAGILSDYYQMNGHHNLRDQVDEDERNDQEEEESTLDPTEKGTSSNEEEEEEEGDEKKKKEQEIMFVHINKTGGTSMVRMLSERCSENDVYQTANWDDTNGVGHRTFHLTAHGHIRRYGRKRWNEAYTFAIVRHPLARQVSNFFFLAGSHNCGSPMSKCTERLIPNLDLQTMSDDDKIAAFHTWIQVVYKAFPPTHPEHYRFGAAGHGNEVYSTFGATQSSWMVDPNKNNKGAIIVKDVFKLEELSDDISKLSSKVPCLGSLEKMYRKNTTAKYPHYMLFGTNKETNSIINTVFADDFRNLHYEPLQ